MMFAKKFAATLVAATIGSSAVAYNTVVEIAVEDDRFSPLVVTVCATSLVDTLKGPGPFTVNAPLNDARAALTNELLSHVADRNLTAGISTGDGTGDTSNVAIADIQADTGLFPVIDKVLLPGSCPDCH